MNAEKILFKQLNSNEKGKLGEALARIIAKRFLKKEISLFIPDLDSEKVRIEEGIPELFATEGNQLYKIDHNNPNFPSPDIWEYPQWTPDVKLKINYPGHSTYDPSLIVENVIIVVYLEIKTGKHAKVERSQKFVMECVNNNKSLLVAGTSNLICLRCDIIPDDDKGSLLLKFYRNSDNTMWKEFKRYEYSDY
jgi:hypothetical protein